MAKYGAFGLRDRGERADLIQDEIGDFSRLDAHLAASEAGEIGKARMRANRHTCPGRHAHGVTHHDRIARMKSACDAAGRDGPQKTLVVAGLVNAEGLADVGVQINGRSRRHQ